MTWNEPSEENYCVPIDFFFHFLIRFVFGSFPLWTSPAAIKLQIRISAKFFPHHKMQMKVDLKMATTCQNMYLSTRMCLPLFKVDQKYAVSVCTFQKSAKGSSLIISDPDCLLLSSLKWWHFPSIFCVLLFYRYICTKLVLVDPHVILIICLLQPFCLCPTFSQSLLIVFAEVSVAQNAPRKPQHLNNHLANLSPQNSQVQFLSSTSGKVWTDYFAS